MHTEERRREKTRGTKTQDLAQTFITVPSLTPGKEERHKKKHQARPTVKNYLIESPMSKCNNKQKYTCINMYI